MGVSGFRICSVSTSETIGGSSVSVTLGAEGITASSSILLQERATVQTTIIKISNAIIEYRTFNRLYRLVLGIKLSVFGYV